MDARIPKLRAEAARLKARIDNLTARYTAMVDKITELENLEIIGLVRAEHISIEQLAALIHGGVTPMRKLAPLLCAAALTLSLAVPAGAYYASDEDGANEPGGPITSVNVTSEPVAEPTLPSLGGLTPDGNLALIDDILGGAYYSSEEVGDSQMQFVTVESKNGNTFYLVIDHATGDVYFLNLVDETDLLALLEDEGYEGRV